MSCGGHGHGHVLLSGLPVADSDLRRLLGSDAHHVGRERAVVDTVAMRVGEDLGCAADQGDAVIECQGIPAVVEVLLDWFGVQIRGEDQRGATLGVRVGQGGDHTRMPQILGQKHLTASGAFQFGALRLAQIGSHVVEPDAGLLLERGVGRQMIDPTRSLSQGLDIVEGVVPGDAGLGAGPQTHLPHPLHDRRRQRLVDLLRRLFEQLAERRHTGDPIAVETIDGLFGQRVEFHLAVPPVQHDDLADEGDVAPVPFPQQRRKLLGLEPRRESRVAFRVDPPVGHGPAPVLLIAGDRAVVALEFDHVETCAVKQDQVGFADSLARGDE